ncbi:DUF3800 domain-containing protein [Micromonospora humi]|uniref:DUF3800 domain-containing protein n=1 Tax=Micromonospora humi TaxID=745366 RepID=UPI000B81C6BA|nr:DUF3800 domain-containing protein [Micromonospora humi]
MTYSPSIAFVDESMRQRHGRSGLYVMAATVVTADGVDEIRRAVKLLDRRGRGFHWREAEPAERQAAVAAVAELEAVHHVVLGAGLDNQRQERGRRECLQRLLWELGALGVVEAWLDARREAQNKLDVRLVDTMRVRGAMPDSLRVDHVSSRAEPLICLADIVAGAVTAEWAEGAEEYVAPLAKVLQRHKIHLS